MKREVLFIIALLCAVAQGAWSQNVVNLSTLTSDYVAQNGDVLTGTLETNGKNAIKMSIADNAQITLSNANILYGYDADMLGLKCEGNATIWLEGDNKIVASPGACCIQAGPVGTTLTIKGTGSLYATAAEYNSVYSYNAPAAIGSPYKGSCGDISIEGGNITALGGFTDGYKNSGWLGGAGIGGSSGSNCGDITFKNCTVKATGGERAAGIGKGTAFEEGTVFGADDIGGKCGIITIEEGADITAYGGGKAAGIGGSQALPGCETRIYAGSVVRAYGGKYGAGIGGGIEAGGGPLWIQGGTIYAYGGTDAAGIGGGETGNSGDIVINGGTIYAYGNGWGVGIGAGEDGNVNDDWSSISINGGTIHAEGGEDIGRAIGGEDEEDYDANVLSFGPGLYVYTPLGLGFPDIPFYNYERNSNLQRCRIVDIKPCEHPNQELSYAYLNDEKHRFYCKWCGFMDEAHTLELDAQDQFSCTKCSYSVEPQTVHFYEMVYNEGSQKYEYQKVASEFFKNSLVLPAHHGTVPADRVFARWTGVELDANDDGIVKEDSYHLWPAGQYISTDAPEISIKARYVNKTLDLATVRSDQTVYDGVTVTGTLNTADYPVKITIADGATVTLSGINISGVNNANYNWAGITCEGNATIILADGTTNTVKGFYEQYPGFFVPASSILTIDGEGSLNASSNGFGAGIGGGYYGDACGIININGGNITATGGRYAAGIGSSHNNSCSHIIISGGTIHATGGDSAAGIGSGWGGTNQGDFSSCGLISITNGVTSVTATKGSEDAPNSIGAGDHGTCLSSGVAIGNMVGVVTRSPYNYVPLPDEADNSSKISAFENNPSDVTLYRRTLYKDGAWNTLCLPFALNSFAGTPLEGAMVKTLESASFNEESGELTLNFTANNQTAIEAGKPYIVKWASGDNIESPTFTNVTISTTTPTDITPTGDGSDGSVTFKGTFGPVAIGERGDNTKLYLGGDNKLYWPNGAMSINSFRAYFQLNDITAGNPSSSGVRAFVLNFDGEEQTGITTTNYTNFSNSDNAWYTLDGRKFSGKPTAKGLYINNGKKVVIK